MNFSASPSSGADSSYDSGVKQFGQKNFQQALASFSLAEQGGKKDANLYYYQALCNQQLKNYAKARELFQYVRVKFPSSDAAILSEQALGVVKTQTPASAAVEVEPQDEVQETRIPFTRYPSGSHIYIKVLVNGKPMTMMLDTGASYTTFAQSSLNKAGVQVKTVKNAMRMVGVGGEAAVSVGRVTIQFGEISQVVPICIQDDTIPGSASDVPLLGQSFLSAFNYEIDYRSNSITLSRMKQTAAQKSGRSVRASSRDPNVVPFSREGSLMIVTAKVNGRECDMFFDTGAANINFSDKTLAAIGVNVPTNSRRQMSTGLGGGREGYGFFLDEVTLGPVRKTRVLASMASYSSMPKPLLGFSFLDGTSFIVDNEASVLRFQP